MVEDFSDRYDDGEGQRAGFNNNASKIFVRPPETIEELFIRCGSNATMTDIMDHQRILQLAFKYRNHEMLAYAMGWFNGSRGAGGEANQQAMAAAVGELHQGLFAAAEEKRGRGFGPTRWLQDRKRQKSASQQNLNGVNPH